MTTIPPVLYFTLSPPVTFHRSHTGVKKASLCESLLRKIHSHFIPDSVYMLPLPGLPWPPSLNITPSPLHSLEILFLLSVSLKILLVPCVISGLSIQFNQRLKITDSTKQGFKTSRSSAFKSVRNCVSSSVVLL